VGVLGRAKRQSRAQVMMSYDHGAGVALVQGVNCGSFEYLLWLMRVSPFGRSDISLPPMEDICVT
jgi:hypothetical protein